MACDREMLLLVSAYADCETSPEQSAMVEAHLETCADCKASLQDWQGQKELLNWAYTVPLPELSGHFERTKAPVVPKKLSIVKRMKTMSTQFIGYGKVAVAAIVVILVIAGGVKIQQMRKPSYMPVGKSLVSLNHEKHISTEENVRLTLGPDSIITRINDNTIRLQKGWVEADVREHAGLKVLTDRMEVTDQGTKFRVGTRPVLDYVLVDKGSVSVFSNKTTHQVKAGQAIIVPQKGKVWVADLPEETDLDRAFAKPLGQEEPFSPGDFFELERREGMKRLAERFPGVYILTNKTMGSWSDRVGPDSNITTFNYTITLTAGSQSGLKDHFTDIAQVLAGGTIDTGTWEIPIAVAQLSGINAINRLHSDAYYVQIASNGGTIVWRFIGSNGSQVDLPLSTGKLKCLQISGHGINTGHRVKYFEEIGLLDWPGELSPVLKLELGGRSISEVWQDRMSEFAKVERQIPQTADLDIKQNNSSLAYLDANRINRVFIAWNTKAGKELCELQREAKKGHRRSAVLAVFSTSVPLLEPESDQGIYFVKFVIPAHSESPYIELATLNNRVVSTWNASSTIIIRPKKDQPESNGGAYDSYNPVLHSGYGRIDFYYKAILAKEGGFNIRFQVIGLPDDKSTLPMKIKGGWQQRDPTKTWAEGWIRLKQP